MLAGEGSRGHRKSGEGRECGMRRWGNDEERGMRGEREGVRWDRDVKGKGYKLGKMSRGRGCGRRRKQRCLDIYRQ